MTTAYYNEIDPFAAQWLRNLIAAGHVAPGDVDERDIREITAGDVSGYDQCHFFAGIGVWSYALRRAGWEDNRRVWTGSCPCQPFSAAGKGLSADDPRHLWPTWVKLIRECAPVVIFGEQVASKDGLAWLDLVYTDLEEAGYAVGAADICAAGFGAPHIRQRLYFVADAEYAQRWPSAIRRSDDLAEAPERDEGAGGAGKRGKTGELGFANGAIPEQSTRERTRPDEAQRRKSRHQPDRPSNPGGLMGHATLAGERHVAMERKSDEENIDTQRTGPTNGYWRDAIWLPCRDGKARPTQPGIFPLAHGAAARVGRLRAYGNAVVAPQAEEWIRAYMETCNE